MSTLSRAAEWLRRCGHLSHRAKFDEQIGEEAQFHIEMRSSELQAVGVPPTEAEAQARREFGPVLRMEEASREAWRFPLLAQIFGDIRYAFRQLLKSPVFTLVSLLSLALGIGATTSVFSVIYGALLHPFPYRGADRMVTFQVTDAAGYNGFTNYLLLSARQFEDIQRAEMLDGVIATDNWDMAATGQDLPEAVHTGKLSANAFDYFGVPPILGRVFTSADGPFGEAPQRVVVLSYRFWRGHFGGDPAVLGKTLQLDHEDYRIIGVVPLQFAWFHSDVYVPLRLTNDPDRVSMIHARLKPGVTIKAAEDSLQPLIESFAKESPKHFPRSVRLRISNLNAAAEKRLTGTLSVLFIAVTLLLAVGCANVSILLLTHTTARRHELAVRAAIGASRRRIIRQLLTEALLLAMMGCLVGVAVAYRSVPFILGKMPENSFPNEAAIQVNGSVLLFSILSAVSTGVLFGLWPALRSSRLDIIHAIQSHTKRASGSIKDRRTHGVLIAGQVSLTVLLLAGAGASSRTFLQLYQSPLGYDPHHLLIVSLQFPDGTHTQLDERQGFYAQVRQRVVEIPGVETAAIYPFGFPPRAQFVRQLEIFDQPNSKGRSVYTNPVSREFFEALKIPTLEGRIWSEQESSRAAHVVVVNQAFAQRYWPGGSPIGHRMRMPDFTAFTSWMLAHPGTNGWLEIIGVVGNTPNHGLSEPANPAVYVPYSLVLGDSFNLAIRTSGQPMSFMHAVREAVHSVSATQPVNEMRTAEDILAAEGWATEKFVATLFVLFALLALALAGIGLYSVVSFVAIMRYQEFGIRMALGAQKTEILKLVLSSGIRAVGTGFIGGLVLCLVTNEGLRHWTRSSMYDPVVILSVALFLFFMVTAASLWPAWRGTSLDPIRALRHE